MNVCWVLLFIFSFIEFKEVASYVNEKFMSLIYWMAIFFLAYINWCCCYSYLKQVVYVDIVVVLGMAYNWLTPTFIKSALQIGYRQLKKPPHDCPLMMLNDQWFIKDSEVKKGPEGMYYWKCTSCRKLIVSGKYFVNVSKHQKQCETQQKMLKLMN